VSQQPERRWWRWSDPELVEGDVPLEWQDEGERATPAWNDETLQMLREQAAPERLIHRAAAHAPSCCAATCASAAVRLSSSALWQAALAIQAAQRGKVTSTAPCLSCLQTDPHAARWGGQGQRRPRWLG